MQISFHAKDALAGWRHIITADADNTHAWRTNQDQFAIDFLRRTGSMVVTMGDSMWEVVK